MENKKSFQSIRMNSDVYVIKNDSDEDGLNPK
jgi:hypothetical protein